MMQEPYNAGFSLRWGLSHGGFGRRPFLNGYAAVLPDRRDMAGDSGRREPQQHDPKKYAQPAVPFAHASFRQAR